MTRRPAALIALALAMGLAVSACAATPVPDETTAQPTPTPTPTVEARVVESGAQPPTVFDGDCAAALTAEQVSSVIGTPVVAEDAEVASTIANVGGVSCRWSGDAGAVRIQILPQVMLAGAAFSAESAEYYFTTCDPNWVCGWQSESEGLWAGGGFQLSGGMTREGVDAWADQLAALVETAYEEWAGEAWTRDEAGWWPVIPCESAAVSISETLGAELSGQDAGYIDPPIPGVVLADLASNAGSCLFSSTDGSVGQIELYASSGTGWSFSSVVGAEIDTGVPGITARVEDGFQSTVSIGYVLTDGVNLMHLYVPTTASWSAEQALTAVAEAAASGW